MMTVTEILNEILAARQRKNPSYSLRAFARDIGINPGSVSAVLAGNRPLPAKVLGSINQRLNLSPREGARLRKSVLNERVYQAQLPEVPSRQQVEIGERDYHILAEWEHYAVLTLMETADFFSDEDWIAERLGISLPRVKVVIQRLLDSGLIKRENHGFVRTFEQLKTSEDVSSPALMQAHLEELNLATKALQRLPVDERDFSSNTLAIRSDKLPEAKQLIRRFRREMSALLESADADSVFLLAIQMFPITRKRPNRTKEELQ